MEAAGSFRLVLTDSFLKPASETVLVPGSFLADAARMTKNEYFTVPIHDRGRRSNH